eukprot:Cvel_27665.t1-p1 / transcript=Cvel_27665.t1 / gene=Cvel_27665 / organism=Chromera_velia_CCMP2878 / gene_product=hypothetical protein / transcript_product=hypothetical protein / location=Cvel_scaffold3486:9958-10515(-) / protein_length=186 / sequence_SO=supercontig / SO=protein_coding / is_pseudo=false
METAPHLSLQEVHSNRSHPDSPSQTALLSETDQTEEDKEEREYDEVAFEEEGSKGCKIYSDKKYVGYYVRVKNLNKGQESSLTVGDSKTDQGDKCGGYNNWIGCKTWCPNINWPTVSACEKPVTSFKCDSGYRVKLCNKATRVTRTWSGGSYTDWSHSECTTYDWGQDKKNVGNKGIYFTVKRKNS